MSICMTEELNSNWRVKNLTVMTGTLWRSKVLGNNLARVPLKFLKIVSNFIEWVFEVVLKCGEATILEVLRSKQTVLFELSCNGLDLGKLEPRVNLLLQ